MHIYLSIALFFNLVVSIAGNCNSVPNDQKVDCGHSGTNQQQCLASNCCWHPVNPNPTNVPWCFYPSGHTCAFNTTVNPSMAPFNASEMAIMKKFFFLNIDIDQLGGVIASPDPAQPHYHYHWERDGSLTIRTLMFTESLNSVQNQLQAYVQWVLRVQNQADPNGIDIRIEPKYNLPQGQVFNGGWCRPQNDGPALRSSTLIEYAHLIQNTSSSGDIRKYLWTGNPATYNGGAIKYDLDWIVSGYGSSTCDLWEEVHNNDFFWNRYSMLHALKLGTQFALKMGDVTSADSYNKTAQAVEAALGQHYANGFIYESSNRKKDAAVINALNEAFTGEALFAPNGEAVANTIQTLNSLFCNSFQINQKDNEAQIPGVMYGRYEGDSYMGGNPWILTSAGLAQLFFRGATLTLQDGLPPEPAQNAWATALQLLPDEAHTFSLSKENFAQKLANAGDAILWRLRYHVQPAGFHLSEQIDRNSGVEVSAKDLTWSYATVFKAMKQRQMYYSLLKQY